MKVNISSIIKTDGASLLVEYQEMVPDLNLADAEFTLSTLVKFSGQLVNISGILKLDGRLEASYTARCNRCLISLDKQISIKVHEEFLNAEISENSEAYTYNDNFVLLDDVIRDNIILNLPVKQVCKEDCKGLCPRCGTDLNTAQCACESDTVDSRMLILKDFFKD